MITKVKKGNDGEIRKYFQKTSSESMGKSMYGKSNVSGNTRTKIYCYSLCGSTGPSNARRISFKSVEEAVERGYRLCRQCQRVMNQAEGKREKVVKVANFLRENYGKKIEVSELSRIVDIPEKQLRRAFMDTMGITPKKYLEELRVIKLKEKLSSGKSINEAVDEVGHSSLSWLYSSRSSKLGMSPAVYRRGGKGESLLFSSMVTQFGVLAVCYTGSGICGVTLSDSRDDAMEYMKNEYQNATISEAEDSNHYLDGIMEYLQGADVNLPLDMHGTDFQKKVWSAIKRIPYGSTITYSELAESIGHPRSYRAVANACGDNPVPLIVPCHRVIRKNGELGGYGMGIERKKKILEFEKFRAGDSVKKSE